MSRTVSEADIVAYAALSGDYNPVHLDPEYASRTIFKERIAHGMFSGALISAAVACTLPGPGTIYLGQTMKFTRPVKFGDTLTVQLEILEKLPKFRVRIGTRVVNQRDEIVVDGERKAYRYVKALPAQEFCLQCHGTSDRVSPAVQAKLEVGVGHGRVVLCARECKGNSTSFRRGSQRRDAALWYDAPMLAQIESVAAAALSAALGRPVALAAPRLLKDATRSLIVRCEAPLVMVLLAQTLTRRLLRSRRRPAWLSLTFTEPFLPAATVRCFGMSG